jgi:hypothetical protein
MTAEHDLIDLWRELEDELKSGSKQGATLSPVNEADAGWLRAAEDRPEIEEALTRIIDRHGSYFHRVIVQSARCTTKEDLLRTLGDALEFPCYYGINWDALNECLEELLIVTDGRLGSYFGDRSGRRARSLVLTVSSAELLLNKEPRSQFDTFLDILRWVASQPADPLGRELTRGQLFVLFSVTAARPAVGRHISI